MENFFLENFLESISASNLLLLFLFQHKFSPPSTPLFPLSFIPFHHTPFKLPSDAACSKDCRIIMGCSPMRVAGGWGVGRQMGGGGIWHTALLISDFIFSHSGLRGGLVNPNSRLHSSPFSLKRFFLSPTKFFCAGFCREV